MKAPTDTRTAESDDAELTRSPLLLHSVALRTHSTLDTSRRAHRSRLDNSGTTRRSRRTLCRVGSTTWTRDTRTRTHPPNTNSQPADTTLARTVPGPFACVHRHFLAGRAGVPSTESGDRLGGRIVAIYCVCFGARACVLGAHTCVTHIVVIVVSAGGLSSSFEHITFGGV